ncbi:MAG: hypothetical protein HDQ88_04520 [Clostridia bacterium]|nr:hypothetical protein [Clostridia bacterium]
MDKKFIKKILAVVLGMSLLIMIYRLVSLIMDASLTDDAVLMGSSDIEESAMFMKWTSVALICLLVPTLTCYAFAFFGNKKIFTICSAVLSLFVAVCCIAFFAKMRSILLEDVDALVYASGAGYFSEMMQLAVPSLIACAYFTVCSVLAFKKVNNSKTGESNEEN